MLGRFLAATLVAQTLVSTAVAAPGVCHIVDVQMQPEARSDLRPARNMPPQMGERVAAAHAFGAGQPRLQQGLILGVETVGDAQFGRLLHYPEHLGGIHGREEW